MSKLKKLGIIIFITVIAVLGINAKSNAYYVGETIKINYSKYLEDDNMFCMEHTQALLRDEKEYNIISNVKIEGNKSTDHKGKTIESWYNSKMVSILNNDNGAKKEAGPVQNAIWNFGYTWMKNVGQYHNGLYLGFANNSRGTSSSIDESSSNDANNVNMELKDNTNKEKINVASYEKNGEKYLRIGPFKWTFSGELTEIKVYNQDEKVISGILYSSFKGTTENWFGLNGIISGSDFYISIPANSGTAEITKIYAKTANEVKAVNIWFLEATDSSWQNLIIAEPDKTTTNPETTFDYNIQMYVKLSGYVWVDKIAEKTSVRNDLFKENDHEYDDILLDGITVRLKNKTTGATVKQTTTAELGRYKNSKNNGHGEYLFEGLLIKELANYYIEFEYDGLTYTNVIANINKHNGSKAIENANTRNEFNNKFSIVEGNTENTGFTRDVNGNKVHNLSYNINRNAHTATLIKNGQYLITANTQDAQYNIKSHYNGQEEIRDINLGLYEREQPDIALVKDIENVRLSVNGFEHTIEVEDKPAGTYQMPKQNVRTTPAYEQITLQQVAREQRTRQNEAYQQSVMHRQQENRNAMQQVHASRMEAKTTSILERAVKNVDEDKVDITLESMEREHNHSERVSAAEHHHPEDVIPENMLGTIEDLMIKGYDGNLCFERDFVGEAMDMISRFSVPSDVPDFSEHDVA